MFVCICTPTTEEEVQQCIAAGASTVFAVRLSAGISGKCFKCNPYIKQMIKHHKGIDDVTTKSAVLEQ